MALPLVIDAGALTELRANLSSARQDFSLKIGKMRFAALSIEEYGASTIQLAPVVGSREPAHVSLYLLSHSCGWKLKIAYAKFMCSTDVRCLE